MKLLIATDNYLPRWDGVARFLAEILPRLTRHFDVRVISPDYGKAALDDEIERFRIPLGKRSFGDYTPPRWEPRRISKAVKQADIVFTQTIGPIGLLANRAAKRQGKPLVAFTHSIERELFPKALEPALLKRIAYPLTTLLTRIHYNRCDLLFVPSDNIGDMLTWQGIRTRKRVVHLGVNTREFTRGDKAEARAQLGIPDRATVVGFHGRLGHEKNLMTLARAFVRLKGEKRLLIVGDGLPSIRKRLAAVKGSILPGAQRNVLPYLRAMDIYVMPSHTETTSLAVLEAMSCELPVVSSPVGFIRQYIVDGENGFFFKTKDSYDLARRLQQLVDDPALRERVGKKARRMIRGEFDWEIAAERITESLRKLA